MDSTSPATGVAASRCRSRRGDAPRLLELRARHTRNGQPVDGRHWPTRSAGPGRADARRVAELATTGPASDARPRAGHLAGGDRHHGPCLVDVPRAGGGTDVALGRPRAAQADAAESPARRLARVRRARPAHRVRGTTAWSRASGARSAAARVALR